MTSRSEPSTRGPVSRRSFLQWSAVGGATLLVGVTVGDRLVAALLGAEELAPVALNQWISIGEGGMVTIMSAKSEMGQGVRTAAPMIVADELGADWEQVRVLQARPSVHFDRMGTGGSGSMRDSWGALRPAAAAAREMLTAAAAERWGVPAVECDTEGGWVHHRASGRRIGFGDLVARAATMPVPESPTPRQVETLRLVGTRVKRVDGPLIVSGRAEYGLDIRIPGMRYAAVARAPRLGAVVRSFDASAARAVPGVLDVVQVPFGVAVIADRTWAAFGGRDALRVEWDESRAQPGGSREFVATLESALGRGKRARAEGGSADSALAGSATRLERTYHYPFQAHAALEPLNCTVELREDGCELWVGTQHPNLVQVRVARLLGLRPDQVTVNIPLLGGGFGRRLAADYATDAVEVARAARVPVQVVWSREDDMRHAIYHPGQVDRLSAGIDATGRVTAWRHLTAAYHLSQFGGYDPEFDPSADGDPWGAYDTPYRFPALEVRMAQLEAPVPTGSWRSVGYPASVFARESFLDEVAHALRADPVALRLSLLPSPGTATVRERDLPNGDRLRHVLQLVAERAAWERPFARERGERRWGRGVAINAYHRQTMVAQVAEISVGPAGDVRVHRVVSAVDCGIAVNPLGVEGQFESGITWALSAMRTQMVFERGRAVTSNYSDFPVLRMPDAPAVEVHIVPSTLAPMGIGEQPVPAVAPAVTNAIFAATGVRLRELPIASAQLALSAKPESR